MDIFQKASTIRLISHSDRFLIADEDNVTISQGGDRSAPNAIWAVEIVEGKDSVRLKSCYGTYLTASPSPILPGVTGKKVVQSWPCQFDAAAEWEPSRDGMQVRLTSIYGHLLRPNGGLPPWRNVVTHEVSSRGKTREKALWDVEVVEKWSEQQQRVASPSFRRSRTFSSSMDEGDEDFYNVIKWWWYPKACMPF